MQWDVHLGKVTDDVDEEEDRRGSRTERGVPRGRGQLEPSKAGSMTLSGCGVCEVMSLANQKLQLERETGSGV